MPVLTCPKCRFCGQYEGDPVPFRGVHMVRYGKRGAMAHLRCLAVSKGSDFVLTLSTPTLEYMQVRDLGFEEAMRSELAKRSQYCNVARATWRVQP